MHRRLRIIIGLLLATIAVVILFAEGREPKIVQEERRLITQEAFTQATLKEKPLETYVGIDVKRTADKELVIQVVGGEEYFLAIKDDLMSIAKNTIQNSVLKDYTIVFERWELTSLLDYQKMDDSTNFLIEALLEGLQAFDVYEYLTLENQTTITIHTTIKDANHEALTLVAKMEDTINKIVQTNAPQQAAYVIHILNAQREKIN